MTAGDDVGWESYNLSDTDGVIAESVTFEFANTHDSYGLTVNFPTNSFAKDFTITYYAGVSVLETVTVTDNATDQIRARCCGLTFVIAITILSQSKTSELSR